MIGWLKPKWTNTKTVNGRWAWSVKERRFLIKHPNFSIKKLSKILGRTQSSVKRGRAIFGVASRFAFLTFEEVQKRNPRVLRIRKVNSSWAKNRNHTLALISCPIQSLSCRARKPRWIQARQAARGGRCTACANNKGGSVTSEGYRRIRVRDTKGNHVTVLEHRLVMEKILRRPLTTGETVHHGPGGRRDNRPQNLELRAPGKHKQGWSIPEMLKYLRTVPKSLGGLK